MSLMRCVSESQELRNTRAKTRNCRTDSKRCAKHTEVWARLALGARFSGNTLQFCFNTKIPRPRSSN